MREESVARRYAAALFAQAKKTDALQRIEADLALVAEAMTRTPMLRSMLAQPQVTEARKKQSLRNAFGDQISPATLAFLNLLVDKRRADLLVTAQAEFTRMSRDYRNVARATATSAVPLTPEQTAALEASLEARTGKDIELETAVDPSLIGGVLVRIGDTVLDGSVRGSLDRLREQLLTRRQVSK
jgi:F-type H+-transporting ATPase subunit delta